MFKITYSKRFAKNYKKLSETEKTQVKNKVKILLSNPKHPSLRTKKIKGLKNTFESSVNMDIRLIWNFQEKSLILILDVGHHKILDDI